MKTILSNDFIDVNYDEAHQLIVAVWKPASERMTDEDFKYINYTYLKTSQENKVHIIEIDTRNMRFAIHPDLQAWVAENIVVPMVGNGAQKLAIIVSEDLIVQLSIEQTMEETESIFQTRYFSNQESARKWLLA
jgi:hypothetical protein